MENEESHEHLMKPLNDNQKEECSHILEAAHSRSDGLHRRLVARIATRGKLSSVDVATHK